MGFILKYLYFRLLDASNCYGFSLPLFFKSKIWLWKRLAKISEANFAIKIEQQRKFVSRVLSSKSIKSSCLGRSFNASTTMYNNNNYVHENPMGRHQAARSSFPLQEEQLLTSSCVRMQPETQFVSHHNK